MCDTGKLFPTAIPWTEDEKTAFAEMWAAGRTVEYIAAEFRRSQDTIKRYAKIFGLPERHRGGNQTMATQRSTVERPCLRCRRPFRSTHKGNRLCNQCSTWAAGQAPDCSAHI